MGSRHDKMKKTLSIAIANIEIAADTCLTLHHQNGMMICKCDMDGFYAPDHAPATDGRVGEGGVEVSFLKRNHKSYLDFCAKVPACTLWTRG